MGEVYRARDTRLGRDVAIKILSPRIAADRDAVLRFEREARALATLNHPNIAAIYDVIDSGGQPALVLELVEGETLAERISQRAVSMADALEYARQIADALDVAHESGIVHRDLKPGNIKVTEDGRIKVLDFGLAKAIAAAAGESIEVEAGELTNDYRPRHAPRRDSRHRRLHESRAGARQARRQAHRHLGVRLRAVRNAHASSASSQERRRRM